MNVPHASQPPGGEMPILAMPSPRVLKATAVWLTARNWALAAAKRFSDVWILTPDGPIPGEEIDEFISQRLSSAGPAARVRSRVSTVTRTLVKDARVAVENGRARSSVRRLQLPSQRIPFVWQHHDPFFRLGTTVARRVGAPLVQFVDAPHVWEAAQWGVHRPGWGRLYERVGEAPQLREADLVLCVSEAVADAVRTITRGRARVAVTPCTADPAFFEPQDTASVRAELGLAPDDVVVGWAGSFRRFHGVDQLLDAFAELAAPMPDLRLLLVGDGAERSRLQQRAEQAGVAQRIVFTGQIPFHRMPAHVATMDIAVVTAQAGHSFHYSPLKMREYRASGRAIVGPDVGQVSTVVRDGHDGLLYRPDDPDSLTQAVAKLARDASLRDALGRSAQQAEWRTGGATAQVDLVVEKLSA